MLSIRYMAALKNKIEIDIPSGDISKEMTYYYFIGRDEEEPIDEMKGVECAE